MYMCEALVDLLQVKDVCGVQCDVGRSMGTPQRIYRTRLGYLNDPFKEGTEELVVRPFVFKESSIVRLKKKKSRP